MATVIVIASVLTNSGAGEPFSQSLPTGHKAAPEKCPYARLGVNFYRGRYIRHTLERGARLPLWRKPRNCADARYLANVWAGRAKVAKIKTQRWKAEQRRKMRWDPMVAINTVFGPYAPQAHRVASCESGHSPSATNGQYLGMFQMGSYARSRFGHGPDPLTQARAAYAYFVASGRDWSPWSCRP